MVTSRAIVSLLKLQGGEKLKRKNMGDYMGEIDKDGIAEWYPNCKVRFDGSHYVATPHTTNPTIRKKREEEKITVSVKDGKYVLNETLSKPVNSEQVADKQVCETKEKSPSNVIDEPETSVRQMTLKEIFDNLYDGYLSLKPKERKRAIYEDMQPLFNSEKDLEIFVENNCFRRWRNIVVRRQRFARKAYNQQFGWFATFTYSDEKHTEESFKQRLLETLRHLATRRNWLYMGVWERGKDTNRLHFHALVYAPDNEMVGELEEVTDYNKKTGRRKTFLQNTFFRDKFGRNEFDDISISNRVYGQAIGYVMKYMEKNNAKAVYSRGLYEYFRSDIDGKDVVAKMSVLDETNIKLILDDKFTCWEEGALVGEVSRDTIAQMPKTK